MWHGTLPVATTRRLLMRAVHQKFVWVVCVFALTASWAGGANADLSTARKAATAFSLALQKGDFETIRAVTTGQDADYKVIRGVAAMTEAANKVQDALVSKFGEEGKKIAAVISTGDPQKIPQDIAASEERISGDTALIITKGTTEANAVKLTRVDGDWKVDLAHYPLKEQLVQNASTFDAMSKLLTEIARDFRGESTIRGVEAGQDIQQRRWHYKWRWANLSGRQRPRRGEHKGVRAKLSNRSSPGHPTLARGLLAVWTAVVLLFLYVPVVSYCRFLVQHVDAQRDLGRIHLSVVLAGVAGRAADDGAGEQPDHRDGDDRCLISARDVGGVAAVPVPLPVCSICAGADLLSMIVPEVIMGVSLLLLFGVMRIELGFTTVIVAHVTFCFPFVMIPVGARLAGLDPSLEEAAMDLGATPAAAFVRVILPYLMPAVIAGR